MRRSAGCRRLPAQTARRLDRIGRRLRRAAELLLRSRRLSSSTDAPIGALPWPHGVRRCGGASWRGDAARPDEAARVHARGTARHQPAHVGALATVVVVDVSDEPILGQPARPIHACGRRSDDASVAPVADDAGRRRAGGRGALALARADLDPAASGRGCNVRVASDPQRMRVSR